ncbi:hypothetical protein F2Q68_00004503 [Brassica cretica]|uniref:Uncharacterized protein n=1 Tax=Brassica cretica TaxID=69181 RepID=A0A8S9JL79_BRACR|nr:hypothetical protein F2Q68_00004503 [Brassica cretica]
MSAKKAAPKRAAPSETEDEVQFIRSSKRQAATAMASSSKKKSKASESTPKGALLPPSNSSRAIFSREGQCPSHVRNQDEAGTQAAAENVSLREQLEQREEEVCYLRCAAETFDAEKTMAVSGAIVVPSVDIEEE